MTLSKGVAESFGVVSRFLAHYYPAKREGDRTFETPYIYEEISHSECHFRMQKERRNEYPLGYLFINQNLIFHQ